MKLFEIPDGYRMLNNEELLDRSVKWISNRPYRVQILFRLKLLEISRVVPNKIGHLRVAAITDEAVPKGIFNELIACLVLVLSVLWALLSLTFEAELFARSGAVLVAAGAVQSYFRFNELVDFNRQYEDIYYSSDRLDLIRNWTSQLSFFSVISGTLIWAYGDKWKSWMHESWDNIGLSISYIFFIVALYLFSRLVVCTYFYSSPWAARPFTIEQIRNWLK